LQTPENHARAAAAVTLRQAQGYGWQGSTAVMPSPFDELRVTPAFDELWLAPAFDELWLAPAFDELWLAPAFEVVWVTVNCGVR
jgi:hypothetical protein